MNAYSGANVIPEYELKSTWAEKTGRHRLKGLEAGQEGRHHRDEETHPPKNPSRGRMTRNDTGYKSQEDPDEQLEKDPALPGPEDTESSE